MCGVLITCSIPMGQCDIKAQSVADGVGLIHHGGGDWKLQIVVQQDCIDVLTHESVL